MILLRATVLTPRLIEFADELADASGGELVVFALDGRHPVEIPTERPILLVTAAACEAIGLYCPTNFAWRCGDYPLYLARKTFPDESFVWQIEYDVRFSAGLAGELFDRFRQETFDLLAPDYEAASTEWPWYLYCAGRDVVTYKCFFPLVRVSAAALDFLIEKRIHQGASGQRRATWPNDEGFVATTLTNAGFACRDFNSFGIQFYSAKTLTFDSPIEGERFDPKRVGRGIYHPVLFGEDYARKIAVLEGRRGIRGMRSRVSLATRLPWNPKVAW